MKIIIKTLMILLLVISLKSLGQSNYYDSNYSAKISFNEGDINTSNNNKRKDILKKQISNELKSYVGSKSSFGIFVECEVSGEDDVIKLGGEFGEKYRKMLQPLFWIVNKLDGDLGVSDAKTVK